MGDHKFRLSDMMPNAWFYKLKDVSKHASAGSHYSNHHKNIVDKEVKLKLKQKQEQQQQDVTRNNHLRTPSRKSYYFSRTNSTPAHQPYLNSVSHSKSSSVVSLFPDPSIKTSYSSANPYDSAPPPTPSPVELRTDRALPTQSSEQKLSCSSSSNNEPRNIVIDIDDTNQLAAKIENSDDFVTVFDLQLRPILTKPKSADGKKLNSLTTSETERRQSASKGLKMRRANSQRINNGTSRRKSVSLSSSTTTTSSSCSKKSSLAESLAIVKRSKNPKEDFKESMVEMIVEHDIRSSKELEELLTCYLSLNSDEYHDLIISVFKQIWFQLTNNDNKMMRRRKSARSTATTTMTPAPNEINNHSLVDN